MTSTPTASKPASKPSPDQHSLAGLFCSSEWHLRRNPRSIAIYTLALHVTKGGKKTFFCSVRQIAKYFGWGFSSTSEAFRECEDQGLFVRLTTGHGGRLGNKDCANTYRVVTHSTLAEIFRTRCISDSTVTGGGSRSQKQRRSSSPVPESNIAAVPNINEGCYESRNSTRSQKQPLVYDVDSTNESTSRVSEEKRTRSLKSESKPRASGYTHEEKDILKEMAREHARDETFQMLAEDEQAVLDSIPTPVVDAFNNMTPLPCPLNTSDYPNDSPVILPYTEPEGYLSEASTAENYDRVCTALSFTSNPARMFLDYDLTSEVDRLYGNGKSVELAELVAEHCPKNRCFIYEYLRTSLIHSVEATLEWQ